MTVKLGTDLSSSAPLTTEAQAKSGSAATKQATGINSLSADYQQHQLGPGAMNTYLPTSDPFGNPLLGAEGRVISRLLFGAPSAAIEARFGEYVGKLAVAGGPIDVNELVQSVLREAYAANTQDLRFFAEKVKFYNNLKEALRNEISRAREAFAHTAGMADSATIDPPFLPKRFEYSFMGMTEAQQWNASLRDGRSADAAFSAATFEGDWKVTSAQRWDPLAIDLDGDGRVSTIATPQGSFVLSHVDEARSRSGSTASMGVDDSLVTSFSSLGLLTRVNEERAVETRFTEWFAPTEGIVVMDRNGDGQIQGEDLFGDKSVTGRDVGSGYEDLALLDGNRDGVVDRNDASFMKLRVWQDKNSDGKVQAGEMSSLYAKEVVSLNVRPTGGAVAGEDASVIVAGSNFTAVDGLIGTRAGLDAYIKQLEEKLNSVGDDAQLANVDLQNMLQKQQQTLQMVSNISKMLHDTAMAVIRKVGG